MLIVGSAYEFWRGCLMSALVAVKTLLAFGAPPKEQNFDTALDCPNLPQSVSTEC